MLDLRALVAAAAIAAPLVAQLNTTLPADRAAGAATISPKELEQWLTRLTSEELAGRGTGSAGFELAAEFVRAHFEALGLEPVGDHESFLLPVPWLRMSVDPEQTVIELLRDEKVVFDVRMASGLVASGSNDSSHTAPLAIARYSGDVGDLESLDVDGCHVLVIADEPLGGLRDYYRISRAIRSSGATLLAIANSELCDNVPGGSTTMPGTGNRAALARGRRPRVFVIPRDVADTLLASCGVRPSDLEPSGGIRVPGVDASAHLVTTTEPVPAHNVAGVLRGSDPELRDEYVMIGSHLDHLGARGQTIWPGADDDGSGTIGVLAIAQAFARNDVRPRRSVLFATFCGEERGLVGSAHFAENPPIPLEQIVTELQLDMIGRSEEHPRSGETAAQNRNVVHLIGSQKLSPDLHELCMRLNSERAGFDIEFDEEDVFYRSDHWNFAREGVPIAFFFTGFHRDYHQPTDTVDKIEFDKVRRIATWVYDIAFELAQAEGRPLVDPDRWEQLERKGRREPVAPLRQE